MNCPSEPSLHHPAPAQKTISAISPCPNDPNLRDIYVSDALHGTLRAVDVEELDLDTGQPWTEQLEARIEHLANMVQARNHALRLLGRRAYSAHQIRQKLTMLFGAEAAATVVDELAHDCWLDDRVCAEQLVESILRRGPAGREFIEARLDQAGIDPASVADLVQSATNSQHILDHATQYISNHASRASDESFAEGQRLSRRLARRGLDEDTIRSALVRAGYTMDTSDGEHGIR